MESGILVLQVNSLEGNGKCHRFRLRQNDSMKKLIEKYAEMEGVISEGVQLIFKGNPITNNDTPSKLQITSEDTLEVCKVPGIFGKRKLPETEGSTEKTSVITALNNNYRASPSPSKRARSTSESEKPRNLNAGLNLEMLNYPISQLNDLKSKLLPQTNTRDNSPGSSPQLELPKNHVTLKRITELEFELGHQKLKNKDLTHLVQMLNAKFILAQRALEEKELLLKQKDKNIEHLNMELERRERILLAYSAVASSKQTVPGSRVSPPSAGASSTGSSSSQMVPAGTAVQETAPTSQSPAQGPSWK